jgi:hypothetical protein
MKILLDQRNLSCPLPPPGYNMSSVDDMLLFIHRRSSGRMRETRSFFRHSRIHSDIGAAERGESWLELCRCTSAALHSLCSLGERGAEAERSFQMTHCLTTIRHRVRVILKEYYDYLVDICVHTPRSGGVGKEEHTRPADALTPVRLSSPSPTNLPAAPATSAAAPLSSSYTSRRSTPEPDEEDIFDTSALDNPLSLRGTVGAAMDPVQNLESNVVHDGAQVEGMTMRGLAMPRPGVVRRRTSSAAADILSDMLCPRTTVSHAHVDVPPRSSSAPLPDADANTGEREMPVDDDTDLLLELDQLYLEVSPHGPYPSATEPSSHRADGMQAVLNRCIQVTCLTTA